MPFHMGPLELFIILIIVLLLFGPDRLSDIGRNLGKGLREFRNEAQPRRNSSSTSQDESGKD